MPGIRAFYNPAVDQPEPPRPALPAGVRAEPAAASLTADELRRFQADLDRYQTDYTTWKEQRGKAISGAEGWLDANERNYGPIYDVNVAGRWLALGAIIVALLGLILAVQRVKERR